MHVDEKETQHHQNNVCQEMILRMHGIDNEKQHTMQGDTQQSMATRLFYHKRCDTTGHGTTEQTTGQHGREERERRRRRRERRGNGEGRGEGGSRRGKERQQEEKRQQGEAAVGGKKCSK